MAKLYILSRLPEAGRRAGEESRRGPPLRAFRAKKTGRIERPVSCPAGEPAYLMPAALRSSAALSVFSHENAVYFSPLASFTSCGVRPKWP